MQTREVPSILPLLLPWLCFLALTIAMPACELKQRESGPLAVAKPDATLELDADRSEQTPQNFR